MKAVSYRFVDGTSCEVEVSDEFLVLYQEFIDEEKRNHWRETWRRVSLDFLLEAGEDFIDPNGVEPFACLMKRADNEKLDKALSVLLPKQRELIEKVFFKDMRPIDIAKEENVDKSAISHRLERIYEKLKKVLQ